MATEGGPPDAPSPDGATPGDGAGDGSAEAWPPRVRYREPLPVTQGTWDPAQAGPSGRSRRAERAEYRQWRRGPRPPWWPENEPWPPGPRRPPWAFGCLFFFVFLLFLALVGTIVGGIVASFGGFVRSGPEHVLVPLLFIGLVLALAIRFAGGGVWRTGRTLDELVEAARAVEAGDYTARVTPPERGPRALRELVGAFDTMTDRLAADEQSRQALLADVSHELRTPLAVIRGSLEAIVDGVHPADEAHLAAIVEETRVMERLVEDLRTIAQAEGGTLPLHPEPTDLADLAGEVVASFTSEAGRLGIALTADVPEEVPSLDLDPVRIREVVANLVTNALRHTPTGGRVTVRVRPAPARLELQVVDTGPGIDPAILPHVFDRFVKTPGSGGSGLGLAIARDLVVAHGGAIDVTSPSGGGTTFTVRLPLARRA
jgi:signal transduction histidine kinase